MSVHQPIDRAAAEAAPDLASALAAAPYLPSRKVEGWTAPRQRQFLELIAIAHSVEAAARTVGLSPQSAYAFRASARGAVFALGWRAALLLARDRLADTLLARAFDGQTVTITRADGSQVERHFHDNRLAMAALTRLDRLADADTSSPAPGGIQAARLVAQEWDGFLDLVGEERGPARAALFLARRIGGDGDGGGAAAAAVAALEPVAALARADLRLRTGAGDPGEIAIDDLDPERRAEWTAGQWALAEAAGLLRLAPPPPEPASNPQPPQHSDDDDADGPVHWDDERGEMITSFPPPADFRGEDEGLPGEEDYWRTLSDDEAALIAAHDRLALADEVAAGEAARDRWFALLAAEIAAAVGAAGAPGTAMLAAGG